MSACACPVNHYNAGVKMPRHSLKNTLKYGEGTEDVWVFTPEFLANQADSYMAQASHDMDDTAIAGAAAERIWEKNRIYGNGEFAWKVENALEAANEASEKACAARAEMDLAMKKGDDYINELVAFNSAASYTSRMFEEYFYLKRHHEYFYQGAASN